MLGPEGAVALVQGLQHESASSLTTLDIGWNPLLRDVGVQTRAEALPFLIKLESLDISAVGMRWEVVEALVEGLQQHNANSFLRRLLLFCNPFGDGGVQRVARALLLPTLFRLQALLLDDVEMSQDGARALVHGI